MARLELLREDQRAGEFRAARRNAQNAVVAVPFWGQGALKTLGIGADTKIRIVCNLDHPGCNPDVIADLRKLNIRVRTHPRLHAKIYATSALAIVGSSNVSSNGLVVEGSGARGWIEANVLSDTPDFVSEVLDLFETIWGSDDTRPVRSADIKAARERRARLPLIGFTLGPEQRLFDAARAHPDAFASVFIAAYSEPLDKGGQKLLKAVQSGAVSSRSGPGVSNFRNAWGYQLEGMNKDDWLINLDCRKKNEPKVRSTTRVTGLVLPVTDSPEPENDLVIALSAPIEVGGHLFRPTTDEKAKLAAVAKRILKAAGDRPLALIDAIAIVDRAG